MNGNDQYSNTLASIRSSLNIVSMEVTIGGKQRNFSFFNTIISRIECAEILQGKSYPLSLYVEPVLTIVDVGANVGATTTYFAAHYPDARVFSFEPDPISYRLLQQNTADLPNVSTFNFGLSDQDEQTSLFLGQIDPATNSLRRSFLNSNEAITVFLKKPQSVFREHGIENIDILKVDTEGNEMPILRALEEMLPRTKVIYLEYHAEEDRLAMDQLLAATHILCSGNIVGLHRGELCYLLRDLLTADQHRLQIT
jgi:FkbM family methyltransferase